MNTVDWLRLFKSRIFESIETKTSWGKNELADEITKVYQQTLEDMISSGGERK
jgi:hypothetical protein